MRKIRARLARWLAPVEPGELRQFRGTTWRLEEITWSRALNVNDSLVLRYVLPFQADLTAADWAALVQPADPFKGMDGPAL